MQLKRELVKQKRIKILTHGNYNDSLEAMGVIAYAKSLLCAAKKYDFISQENAEAEKEHLEIFTQSLSANNSSYSQTYLYKEGLRQIARQWTAIYLAYFTFTCILVINLFPQNRSDRTIETLVWLTERSFPEWLALIGGGIAFIYYTVKVQAYFNDTSRPEWVPHFVSRIINRPTVAITTLLLGVAWYFALRGFL